MRKPNIVFYFSDQQRWDTLGCYGQKLPVTPVLDQLAREGVRFENAFTCQPVCGPARACLQSGQYATQVGCYRNDIPLPTNIPTLAQYLNQAGYETAYVGKWHLASDMEHGPDYTTSAIPEAYRGGYQDFWMASDVLEFTSHGYDGYVFDKDNQRHDFIGYRSDCINQYAIHYLHERSQEKPFFLFISQIEPHHQNDHGKYEGPDGSKERFADYTVPGDLEGTEGDWKENYPDYLGQCNRLDQNVGDLVAALKACGEWENTIFIYTSDHGSHFKTRNSEYKRSCHDNSIHIPLIICGGGFTGGRVEKELVSLIDLPATILDCAGVAIPEQFAGQSLCQMTPREAVFLQISESQVGRAIRTHKWKYSIRAEVDGWNHSCADVYYEEFLYDLENDPYERINLVKDVKLMDVRKKLAEQMKQCMKEAGEQIPEILPAK